MNQRMAKNPRKRVGPRKVNPPSGDSSSLLFRALAASGKAATLALSAAFVLLLLSCFCLFKTKDPNTASLPVSVTIFYGTCLIAGFLGGKFFQEAPALSGLFSGAILLLVSLILSLFLRGSATAPFAPGLRILLSILALPVSTAGGWLSTIQRQKHSHHRPSRRK